MFAGYAGAFWLKADSSAAGVHAFLALFGGLFLLYFLAWRATASRPEAAFSAKPILWWALAFRLAMLPAGLPQEDAIGAAWRDLTSREAAFDRFLLYDQDIWRYLWDGHVAAQGFDPYTRSPAEWENLAMDDHRRAAALFEDPPWEDVFFNLAYEEHRTVYPPLAQLLFRLSHLLAPGSVLAFKLLAALLDWSVCYWLLRALRALGKPEAWMLVYAWNPLAIKEYAGSAHLDPLMLALLTAAIALHLEGKTRGGLICLGLSAAAKLTPLALAPLFLRRAPWRQWPLLGLALLLGFSPYWGSLPELFAGLAAFAGEWIFNPGPWAATRWLLTQASLPPQWASALCGLIFLAVWAAVAARDRGDPESFVRHGFLIMAALILLSATVMPWYVPWALPLAALAGVLTWPVFSALCLISYLVYLDRAGLVWQLWLEYGLLAALALWEWRRKRKSAFAES